MNVPKDGQVWPNTDLDLNKSGDLPMASIKTGLDAAFDTLSPATTAALDRGYQTDVTNDPNDSNADGYVDNNSPRKSSTNDPRGYPVSGFVRDTAYECDGDTSRDPSTY